MGPEERATRPSPSDSWCGVGYAGASTIFSISPDSDIALVAEPNDRVLAFRDLRFGNQWLEVTASGVYMPLADNPEKHELADIKGPSGTKVTLRIQKQDGSIIEVDAYRRAFESVYNEKTFRNEIRAIPEGTEQCPALIGQLTPLVPRYAARNDQIERI